MLVRTSKTETVTSEEERDWLLSFVEDSAQKKALYDEVDAEVLENYFVQPYNESHADGAYRFHKPGDRVTQLKDTETNQMTQTLLAKVLLSAMGEPGFIEAQRVGLEDAAAADVASGLMERSFRRTSGNYRAMYVAHLDAFLFGASVLFPTWAYREGDRVFKSVTVDPMTGFEDVREELAPGVLRDDLELMPLDRDDFFDDPGHDTIEKMAFCARRFVIPRWEAEEMAEQIGPDGKPRWRPAAVRRALESSSNPNIDGRDGWRSHIDRPSPSGMHPDFEPMIGYEGYGQTPYLHRDKRRRRRITVLNGELVESRPMPLNVTRNVPFYELVVNPVRGRFRGIAPGMLARYMQSFYDALLVCLADSVVRSTNPPIAVRKFSGVSNDEVRKWSGIIRVQSTDDIREIQYKPPIEAAFQLLAQMKNTMREGSGASGAVQGLGFGTKRMSGTESAFLAQQVLDRPELIASLFESEYYPSLGLGMFELHQQNINSTEDLARRVGSQRLRGAPELSQIQGDFDFTFVGSRRMQDKQGRLQMIERMLTIIGAIPGAAAVFPWDEALVEWLNAADLHRLEAMVGDPDQATAYVLRTMLMGGKGAQPGKGNGIPGRTPPAGLLPAQTPGGAARA